MNRFTFICLLMVITGSASAQIENPVRWNYSAKKVSDKTYEVYITANLDGNWHIYAQDAGDGPEPTTINFGKNPLVKLDGKVKEVGKLEKEYDPNFKSELKFYNSTVSFIQKVKIKLRVATVISGTVSYMVCNNRKCLPPKEVPFSIQLDSK
ncbi:MAG TPA: protein-disulfide reductase DsbD domain-containing protein [Ferruginibacter sp.]|nr:protein-disulfide reductase DsbD domain-containing protein [Ferruginibacter sp.]